MLAGQGTSAAAVIAGKTGNGGRGREVVTCRGRLYGGGTFFQRSAPVPIPYASALPDGRRRQGR
jgi:hypothetical protein